MTIPHWLDGEENSPPSLQADGEAARLSGQEATINFAGQATGSHDFEEEHMSLPFISLPSNTTSFVTGCALILCAFGSQVCAQSTEGAIVRLPQDIAFKGGDGPPQTIVIYGDPTKPGLFVTRIRFSPGWKDPPHWHPDAARTVVVLSGTFYFGSGEVWDESKFKAYPPGTFYSEPPKSPHFTWAKDGEVIIQLTGIGPTGKIPIKK
jgi:quercetin dioxygenase-like cupin family protein